MDNFDLRKYLVENKLTFASQKVNENENSTKFEVGDKLETYGGGEEVTVLYIQPNLNAALQDKRSPLAVNLLRRDVKEDLIDDSEKEEPFYLVSFIDGTPNRYWAESQLTKSETSTGELPHRVTDMITKNNI
jgi:hypothetical protein